MKKHEKYLEIIDDVIARGYFKDNWASLSKVETPDWYKRSKFGIFIHWGVYSVPAFSNEWYPRHMYVKGTKEYEHHIKTYGPHKYFNYEDFIPMFKGEKFDPSYWIDLFEEAGAKFVMPVAEHHDGFQMYSSDLSEWCATKKGPMRDVLGELKKEIEKRGMVFAASSHRAENYWFMSSCRDFDSGLQDIEYQEPYGYAKKLWEPTLENEPSHDIHYKGPSEAHLIDWLVRTCELVDKYQPQIVWFDWWIQNVTFKPYLKKFAAYYYNRGIEWGKQVTINNKYDAYAKGTSVFDVERGQLNDIRPRFWQTDTAIAKNSWCYTQNNEYKTPESIVEDLIDIVSKNGALLLNVGPKADGTIGEEDTNVLRAIGQWMKINGESIYNTTYWEVFGEGPTKVPEGAFTDTNRLEYTSQDIRFTYNPPYIYANIMSWPKDGKVKIKALADRSEYFLGDILSIDVLGFDAQVEFSRHTESLDIRVKGDIQTTYPVCLKIQIN